MRTDEIVVANLKCHGCAATIKKELLDIEGVGDVTVDVGKDMVTVISDGVARKVISDKLHSLGYPEATEENGPLLQMKSYASCMVGRVHELKLT